MISAAYIKQKSREIGFDDCGMAPAGAIPHFSERLGLWLSQGRHGGMRFMEENLDKRSDPRLLVPGAKSVVSVVLGYNPDHLQDGPFRVARYAYGEDYHVRIKSMLYALIAAVRERYPDFEAKPCVDTVPISDKYWAARCGLGWIGRNTLLITPELGSWVNLGELVTTAEMDEYDRPLPDHCGDCRMCLQACPNHALGKSLDCRRCNAYNTIENREESLPEDLDLRGYYFGCDCCQLVCPYNRDVPARTVVTPEQMDRLSNLPLLSEAEYHRFSRHSAMSRIGYSQLRRNLAHAERRTKDQKQS